MKTNLYIDLFLPMYSGACFIVAGIMAYFGLSVSVGIWATQGGFYSAILIRRQLDRMKDERELERKHVES